MNNVEENLQALGLTNAEAQTYFALIKLAEAKVGDIIKIVKITPSNVHESLEKLTKKGLISFIKKNKVKYYKPTPPESLHTILEKDKEILNQKEKQLSEILPLLKQTKESAEIKQDAEMFFDLRGIQNAFHKLLQEKIKGEEYLFFYKPKKENVAIVNDFFSKLDKDEDLYRILPTRAIFGKEYETLFKKRKAPKMQSKFTDLPIPSSINIYGDKTLIIAWSEKPIAFMIQSSEIAQTFKDLFKSLWDMT